MSTVDLVRGYHGLTEEEFLRALEEAHRPNEGRPLTNLRVGSSRYGPTGLEGSGFEVTICTESCGLFDAHIVAVLLAKDTLQELHLPGCCLLTPFAVIIVLNMCRNLRSLDVSGCLCLDFEWLPEAHEIVEPSGEVWSFAPKNLQVLKMAYVPITDLALSSLASLCPKLLELDITQPVSGSIFGRLKPWAGLSTSSVAPILAGRRNLTNLNLTGAELRLVPQDFSGSLQALSHLGKAVATPGSMAFYDALTDLKLDRAAVDATTLGILAKLTGRLCRLSMASLDVPEAEGGDEEEEEEERDSSRKLEGAVVELLLANANSLEEVHLGSYDLSCPDWRSGQKHHLPRLLATVKEMQAARRLVALRTLDLSGLNIAHDLAMTLALRDASPLGALASLPALRELRLVACSVLTFDLSMLEDPGAAFPELEVLRLDHNPMLPIKDIHLLLLHLAKSEWLPKLRTLGLRCCFRSAKRMNLNGEIEEGRVYSFDEVWGEFGEFDVPVACTSLFERLPDGATLPLEGLDVAGCRLVPSDLLQLPARLPRLRDLAVGASIGGALAFFREELLVCDTTKMLQGLRESCPDLEKLALYKLTGTQGDAAALEALLQSCGPRMRSLLLEDDSRHFPNAFDGGKGILASLPDICPGLEELDAVNLWTWPHSDSDWMDVSRRLPACSITAVSGRQYRGGLLSEGRVSPVEQVAVDAGGVRRRREAKRVHLQSGCLVEVRWWSTAPPDEGKA